MSGTVFVMGDPIKDKLDTVSVLKELTIQQG